MVITGAVIGPCRASMPPLMAPVSAGRPCSSVALVVTIVYCMAGMLLSCQPKASR